MIRLRMGSTQAAPIAGDQLADGRRIVLETSAPGDNTDAATAETARRMGEYIRKAIGDRGVQACAEYAWRHFAAGQTTPGMLAWAAHWYVKHCVSFRQDEATMFRVGAPGQFDLKRKLDFQLLPFDRFCQSKQLVFWVQLLAES